MKLARFPSRILGEPHSSYEPLSHGAPAGMDVVVSAPSVI